MGGPVPLDGPACATADVGEALRGRADRLHRTSGSRARAQAPPSRVDLGPWLPEVADQAERPLCTAAVVAGFAGYEQRRCHGRDRTPSLMFNYRTSRRYSGDPDRWGSTTRHALRAWREYGLVDEESWPFAPDRLETDPPPECFERALLWRQDHFGRIDRCEGPCPAYLPALRTALALGLPVSVEIPLHPSVLLSFGSGDVPPPRPGEPLVARHVVLLSGYDDTARVNGSETEGALLFQNSWGTGWGDRGYGRLPYASVERGLVRDSWVVPGVPGVLPEQVRAHTHTQEKTREETAP